MKEKRYIVVTFYPEDVNFPSVVSLNQLACLAW